ncbi:large ribosomal subunit protein bL19m-like [Saccoglossus kowalevskii]|uniref:Large ribosomal subunit protein bL19m n=1 Tax=Saccoglossus kowalevskii TaxID=10224 RepID=A0ABM0GNF5_SACKO|nr:PREDICTED: 39S ribosomal protein L19, mitochondrial-like [Saccoglossus kowalevskii]
MATARQGMFLRYLRNFTQISSCASHIRPSRCLSTTLARDAKTPQSTPGNNLHETAERDYWEIPQREGQPSKFISPEFFPPKHRPGRRSKLRDYLERKDMLRRRKVIDIPEFYVGSILRVTMSDPCAPGKKNTFVGICIKRGGFGLGATITLRNVIEGQGIEICYELYNPLLLEIDVIRLEKRRDAHLLYLRDALPQYSTFDHDMPTVKRGANDPVPVNDTKVRMKPRPWSKRWERLHINGIDFSKVTLRPKDIKAAEEWQADWRTEDFAKKYEQPIDLVEQIRKELDEWEADVKQ